MIETSKRTIDNCSLIKKRIKQGTGVSIGGDGKCLGYTTHEFDDEPCDQCKKCKLNTSYETEG